MLYKTAMSAELRDAEGKKDIPFSLKVVLGGATVAGVALTAWAVYSMKNHDRFSKAEVYEESFGPDSFLSEALLGTSIGALWLFAKGGQAVEGVLSGKIGKFLAGSCRRLVEDVRAVKEYDKAERERMKEWMELEKSVNSLTESLHSGATLGDLIFMVLPGRH